MRDDDASNSERTDRNECVPTASLGDVAGAPNGQIGPYKLLSVLGEGGCGIVYLAEQHRPIKRRVALKIIKPGMDTKQVIARFEAERQALALLDHPNIARVFNAGTTEAGRPYFVMEYVKGIPITEHCDRHKLTIEERLDLFLQVCEAVQHAHQKGIIHRDIKPSNILVSIEGGSAIPKIIDFGVAKALSQSLTERTLVTEHGQMIGTPEYMSPEQAEMTSQDIDTRSDIYSLGAVLYELLTGVLPFDPKTLRESGIESIRKVIREEDPKTPSTRLSTISAEESANVARLRRTDARTLGRQLHGDLDWITLKAMDKDRTRRYGSAGELAADIGRHLKNEPVAAGPPSVVYRAKKFIRRNRALVTGVAAVLTVLIVGILTSTVLAIGQARARADAEAIARFLSGTLRTVADAKVGEATVSYVLDMAAQKLEDEFKDRPLIEAQIRETLGKTYLLLDESTEAEKHWTRARDIYRQHYGGKHSATLGAMEGLYWVCDNQERHYDAQSLMTEILKTQHGEGYEGRHALAHTYHHLGKYKEAEEIYDKILETVRGEHGENYVRIRPSESCILARVYADQGRYEEAKQLFHRAIETWPEENRWRLVYRADLANMYRDQGRYEEAEPLLVETLEKQRQRWGDEHKVTLRSMYYLARVYTAQARYEEAQSLLDEGLEIRRRRLRQGHPATLRFVNALAVLFTKQDNDVEAEKLFKEALNGRQRELGPDHPETLETMNDLGVLHREQKHYEQAENLLTEALEGRRKKLGDDHPHTLHTMHELAVLYTLQEQYSKAEQLLVDAYHGRVAKLGPQHPHTVQSIRQLVRLYEAWGKPEEAEKWRTKLSTAEAAQ
jgi:serine/threonine protein kinase/tetratricopeptide (TPR) repeat protein